GFGFGFVLERAGFGRAQKLAAQFYGYDMTVFKVMFSAIVTAMLGTVLLGGLGLLDYRALVQHAASETYLWPMIGGGLALGVGFIVSGYCPGTSYVAAASGKVDGMVTVAGVVLGQLAYTGLEHQPWLARFQMSGALGHVFLYDLLHLPARGGPAIVAIAVTAMAVGCFLGAEKLERLLAARAPSPAAPAGRPGKLVFAGMSAFAVVGLAAVALPVGGAAGSRPLPQLEPAELARRVLDAPWKVRVLDLRPAAACAARRVPGASCVRPEELAALRLADEPGARDLVLVAEGELTEVPPTAVGYPGRVYALADGWKGWEAYALTPPASPPAGAGAAELAAYRERAGLASALTGMKAAPPPPVPAAGAGPRKSGGGGGCGG
ncbi:MAG TPA: YeeE/YedE thiosulfate transporter family protein, partial [Anaeromyxobacteraceae bacterium]